MFWKISAAVLIILLLLVVVSNYHLVNTGDEMFIVRKGQMTLENTYVDVSEWNLVDYIENPHISKVLLEKGYEEMADNVKSELERIFQK